MIRPSPRALALVSLLAFLALAPAHAQRDERRLPAELAEPYSTWLLEVDVLVTDEEWQAFVGLDENYQRDAFIERFWRERDPVAQTARNEFRERFEDPFVFYQPRALGKWRLWDPADGFDELIDVEALRETPEESARSVLERIPRHCNREAILEAVKWIKRVEMAGKSYAILMHDLQQPELPASDEWALSFESYSTDVPEDVAAFASELDFDFPSWNGARTVVKGLLSIPVQEVTAVEIAGTRSYNVAVNGEVLRGEELFDAFRMRFDFPAEEVAEVVPVVFERYLRPGEYRLLLRLEDLNGDRMSRHEVDLAVPKVERAALPDDVDPEVRRTLDAAYDAIAGGEASLEIVQPAGDLLTGLQRFDALVVGERVDQVVFMIDGARRLTKKRPPFSVELDLGPLPRTVVLRAAAFDAEGEEIASDELFLNGSPHRFSVRLVDPVAGKTYREGLRARLDVSVPALPGRTPGLEAGLEVLPDDDQFRGVFLRDSMKAAWACSKRTGPCVTVTAAVQAQPDTDTGRRQRAALAAPAGGTYNPELLSIRNRLPRAFSQAASRRC